MIFDEIVKVKPHLKDTLELYNKVSEFKKFTLEDRQIQEDIHTLHTDEEIRRVIVRFSEVFSIPVDNLSSIQEGLLSEKINLRMLPLGHVPPGLPFEDEELASLLFLISIPFFLSERDRLNVGTLFWEEGKCPVCNSLPSVSILAKEEKRLVYCPFCESKGYWKRIGCPHCLAEGPDDVSIMSLEGEEGMRIDGCRKCMIYYKSFDEYLVQDYTLDLLDLISLPLDIVAQDKGFRRGSPNPIGMIRMG
jgi:FdhE protein